MNMALRFCRFPRHAEINSHLWHTCQAIIAHASHIYRTCTAALQVVDLSARLDRTVGELDALQHAHAQLSAATAEDAHVLQSKYILARENVRLGVDCW